MMNEDANEKYLIIYVERLALRFSMTQWYDDFKISQSVCNFMNFLSYLTGYAVWNNVRERWDIRAPWKDRAIRSHQPPGFDKRSTYSELCDERSRWFFLERKWMGFGLLVVCSEFPYICFPFTIFLIIVAEFPSYKRETLLWSLAWPDFYQF